MAHSYEEREFLHSTRQSRSVCFLLTPIGKGEAYFRSLSFKLHYYPERVMAAADSLRTGSSNTHSVMLSAKQEGQLMIEVP